MRNRVLITSVGRKVALVRAFKDAGWFVMGQDLDLSSIALKYCDTARDYNNGWDTAPDIVVPTRDAELSDYAGMLGNNSDDTIEICTDKKKFFHFCKENGFGTPEVYFVKPRISKSGKEVECVWQELLEGEEYSVDLFMDWSGNCISVVPRKRLKTTGGESCVAEVVEFPKLISESEKLAKSLKLVGHNCLQCFVDTSGRILWTDVNCRFGGASIVGIKAGCNSPKWMLQLLNGQEVKPQIGNYHVGLIGLSYTEWAFEN